MRDIAEGVELSVTKCEEAPTARCLHDQFDESKAMSKTAANALRPIKAPILQYTWSARKEPPTASSEQPAASANGESGGPHPFFTGDPRTD